MKYLRKNWLLCIIWLVLIGVLASVALLCFGGNTPLIFSALIASISAVVAALIAYEAASSKVDFDRESRRQDSARREINILFKAEIEINVLLEKIRYELKKVELTPNTMYNRMSGGIQPIEINGLNVPPILWDNLADMPVNVPASVRGLAHALDDLRSTGSETRQRNALQNAERECLVMLGLIRPRLIEIAPGLSDDEVNELLYS